MGIIECSIFNIKCFLVGDCSHSIRDKNIWVSPFDMSFFSKNLHNLLRNSQDLELGFRAEEGSLQHPLEILDTLNPCWNSTWIAYHSSNNKQMVASQTNTDDQTDLNDPSHHFLGPGPEPKS